MFGSVLFALLYLLESVQSQSDLVLIGRFDNESNELKLKCVSTDNNDDKAIAWNTPITEDYTKIVYQEYIEPISKGFARSSSNYRNLGLVLDERWESWIARSNYRGYFDARTNYYEPFSVNFEVEARIYFCKDEFQYCYAIILRSNGEILSGVTECAAKGNCQDRHTKNVTNKLKENQWIHLTVILDKKNNSISLIFEGDETPFLYYQNDTVVKDINSVDYSGRSLWKFHNYHIFVLMKQEYNKEHLLISLFPSGNSVCFSMYVSICDTCTIILYLKEDKNKSHIYKEIYSKKKGSTWQKIKFNASGLDNQFGYSIFMNVTGTSEDKDQIILTNLLQHKSKHCFQDVKYSSMIIDAADRQNVSCQYLLNDSENNKETALIKIEEPSVLPESRCKAGTVGTMCIPCYSVSEDNCEALIICETGGCRCSPGYEGALCELRSNSNVWDVSSTSSDTTISLEWKPLTKSNGKIVEYIVSYQHINDLECFEEDKSSSGSITTTDTQIILRNLNPYSVYAVRIEDSTTLQSEMFERRVSTKPGKFDNGAIDVSFIEIAVSEMQIYFKRNCRKIRVKIEIEATLSCPDFEKNWWCTNWIEDDIPTFVISELKAFTEYGLEFRQLGEETAFYEGSVRTHPSVPLPVTNFEVYEQDSSSLSMRWIPAETATGIIEKYSFFIQDILLNKYIGDRIETGAHTCEVWTSMWCAEISIGYVEDGRRLLVSIQAKNENVDIWSNPAITHAISGITAPESSKFVDAIWDADGFNITLRWQHPDKTNGRLTEFNIYIDKDEGSEIFHVFPVTKYNLTYEITQVIYPDSPVFEFSIIAQNRKGESAASTIFVLNPPLLPKINQDISYEEHTNDTIKVFIPAPIQVQYNSFTYVILSEPGSKDCKQSRSIWRYIKDFKECNIWFAKEIFNQTKDEETVIGDMSRQYSNQLNETIINHALKPYRKYEVYVVVVNKNNNFTRFSVTKALPIYLEPTKVIQPCYTSCEIRLKPNNDSQSSTNVYIIHYKEMNETSWTKINNTLSFTNHSETLDVFKKSTSYNLRIYLVKGEELEMQMPELNFTTSCQKVQLENIGIDAKNISAYLYLKSDNELEICDLKYYNLTVQIPGHEYNKTLKAFNRIEYLQPLTAYNVSILSKNNSLFTTITTDEGSPENVEKITWNSTETTISLEWKEPRITNGEIRGYFISYQHSLYKSCNYIESDDDSNGKNTTSNTKIVLENLNSNSNYTVWINAFTKLPGKLVQTQVSTKPTDELDKDAYQISINEHDNTISLHFWPNCNKIKGPLLIGLMLTCSKSWCNETTNFTIDPLIINYHIRNLQTFTEYQLEFKLLNSVQSIDLFTKTITTTTQPGVPNPVTHFEIYGRTKDGLLLRWKPPEPPTGIIEDYFFSAKHYHDGIWANLEIECDNWYTCKDWSEMMCTEIKGVANELKYSISITAKNQNFKKLSKPVTAAIAASLQEKQSNPILLIFGIILPLVILLIFSIKYYVRKRNTRNASSGNMEGRYTASAVEE